MVLGYPESVREFGGDQEAEGVLLPEVQRPQEVLQEVEMGYRLYECFLNPWKNV